MWSYICSVFHKTARILYITSLESGKKASNEDTDTEFLFAYLKPEGANCRCGNKDLRIKKDKFELHLRLTNKTITKLL